MHRLGVFIGFVAGVTCAVILQSEGLSQRLMHPPGTQCIIGTRVFVDVVTQMQNQIKVGTRSQFAVNVEITVGVIRAGGERDAQMINTAFG